MANTRQAAKRDRQTLKRRHRNRAMRTRFRTAVKRAKEAVAAVKLTAVESSPADGSPASGSPADGGGGVAVAREAMREMASITDRTVGKGGIHKNKAARIKQRLAAALKKTGAPPIMKSV